MSPAELHAWLVARWQEKLDVARVATPGPWDRSFTSVHMDGSGTARIAPVSGGPAVAIASYFRNGADPDHIAAFDPAFAIAVCEAALRRLARHAPEDDGLCRWCNQDEYAACDPDMRLEWPDCPEVLDDAAPFADRGDFPEELRHGHGS